MRKAKPWILVFLFVFLTACGTAKEITPSKTPDVSVVETVKPSLESTQQPEIPSVETASYIGKYEGVAAICVNENIPYFTEDELTIEPFEVYSELDELGRCGVAYANICKELMPTEERGEIGMVKPTGWHTVKYADLIDGNYLYNRCHLIGFQLAGENANEKNLITGTRFLNVEGMLPYENEIADYVKETGNHVLYRVTPEFEGDNLVASGVLMEAYSVEDYGVGVKFCIFCPNVQPGIEIDYRTGDSWISGTESKGSGTEMTEISYIGNVTNHKLHKSTCQSLPSEKNQVLFTSIEEAEENGYTDRCKLCFGN